MRVLHGIENLVNDPGFLEIAKMLELCSGKHIDCNFCPPDKYKRCHTYFDRTVTNCSGRRKRQVKPDEVETQLKYLQKIGVSV